MGIVLLFQTFSASCSKPEGVFPFFPNASFLRERFPFMLPSSGAKNRQCIQTLPAFPLILLPWG